MFNEKIVQSLSKSSMIRAMFEEGARLKKFMVKKMYMISA